jgi:uncharacterized protein
MNNNNNKEKIGGLERYLQELYDGKSDALPFHGWHHIDFVRSKALEFALQLNANLFIVESAALTHDLNYLIKINSNPEKGAGERRKILQMCGYEDGEINIIEKVIVDSHTGYRLHLKELSQEAMALSDADTLFKALPITPILFAYKYLSENKITISDLAQKVVDEQNPLMDADLYFYTSFAKEKYMKWANTNLALWKNVIESLQDDSVKKLISVDA